MFSRAYAHEYFYQKKMPLCHLAFVYRGLRGGIMVALVAFSSEFLWKFHAEIWVFTVFFELINEKVQNFGTSSANRLHF